MARRVPSRRVRMNLGHSRTMRLGGVRRREAGATAPKEETRRGLCFGCRVYLPPFSVREHVLLVAGGISDGVAGP